LISARLGLCRQSDGLRQSKQLTFAAVRYLVTGCPRIARSQGFDFAPLRCSIDRAVIRSAAPTGRPIDGAAGIKGAVSRN
jgi:hypothetical protein